MAKKYYIGFVLGNGGVITDGPLIVDTSNPNKKAWKWEVTCPNCQTKTWKFTNTLVGLKYPCKKCYDNSLKRYDDMPAKKAAYRSLRSNAKSRGYPVDISFEQFLDLAQKDCYYCGDKPKQRAGIKSWQNKAKLNGIDRKDNTLGYTIANSVPCCQQCNWAKKDLSIKDWESWLSRIVNKRRQDEH